MAFSRFKTSNGATPTTAPPAPVAATTPTPVHTKVLEPEVLGPVTIHQTLHGPATTGQVVTPVTVQAAPAVVAPMAQASRLPAAFGGLKAAVLAQVITEAERPAFTETFPHILIKGGNSGGSLVPSPGTEKGFVDLLPRLPQGKQPAVGVFMAIRAEAIAWPRNYDDRQEGEKPSINCAIPITDGDGIALLTTGCENFQFASRDVKRTKWETPNGGPGHLRPVFQTLIWIPGVGPVVLQSAPLLESFRAMAKQVHALRDPKTEELDPTPIVATVTTEPWYDDNVFHYWKVEFMHAKPERVQAAKDLYAQYQAWVQSVVAERADLVQAVADWVAGDDKPPSETDIARLKQAANMVNPRRSRGG